ncbi:MAG TPA: nitrogen fixation protein NifQ, partial [Rhodocyclaceae bacterium]
MMLALTYAMTAPPRPKDRQRLLALARAPEDLRSLAFAGVIGEGLKYGALPLIRGLAPAEFQRLLAEYFPGLHLSNGIAPPPDALDEFDDLVSLLLDHRAGDGEAFRWLACAIATAAMREQHLWQDMGLPSRRELSALMLRFFPALAAKNSGDMKWKKFFYRQLCEQTGLLM